MNNVSKIIKTEQTASGILHVILNRPETRNALSFELLNHLHQLFLQAKMDSTIKAVLLSGEGKAFCAGADIKGLAQLNSKTGLEFAKQGQAVFDALEQLGKPSLVAIHGFAVGGGCELAMSATLRIIADNAFLGQPEIKLGIIPGFGGTQRLARLVGKGRALEFCLTGRPITADEAYRSGLVNEIVSAENLIIRAKELLHNLTQYSPTAINSIITVIQRGYDATLEDGLALEAAHFAVCCSTKDKKEGVQAFLEKRTPVFSGE
ncbi:MAG: enoyl-CoA hydratase [Gammaproteobacteria bacterium RIFCSPHIGHO2_12_FULL_41_20]|nr:MAG: enoyl-CoA hydratase [Gammaproteobacteria bacterium RIFCSPHIGHO2_12_FULL_41_20]